MLFVVSGTLWCHRNNQADGGDFVVTIGSGEHHRQRSTALIDEEEVDLRPEFALSVGFLPTFSPPKGAGECLESIACHFQPIPPRSLA